MTAGNLIYRVGQFFFLDLVLGFGLLLGLVLVFIIVLVLVIDVEMHFCLPVFYHPS